MIKRFFPLLCGVLLLTSCTASPAADETTPSPSATPEMTIAPTSTPVPSPLVSLIPSPTAPVMASSTPTPNLSKFKKAVIDTPQGKITITLSADKAPISVANFKKLVAQKFYDGLTWHRVVPGFVIQTGDPTATGGGGSKETIPLEIACADGTVVKGKIAPSTCEPVLKHTKGALGMARTDDPNSATSQFYITLDATPDLDGKYAVFGYVSDGLDVIAKIKQTDVITSVTLE